MEKKSCFVIMPFSKAKTQALELDKRALDFVYDNIIEKAVADYEVAGQKVFADISRYNSKVGSIVSGIAHNLNKADLVIADLSGLNPNVMYELGVRHSLKRGTIVITQDISAIPSDLRDYMCVEYKFSTDIIQQTDNFKSFKKDLHTSISELFSTDKFDSPVLHYLNGRESYWKEDELDNLKENIVVYNYMLEKYEHIKEIIKVSKGDVPQNQFAVLSALLSNMLSAFADLRISIQTSILYEDIAAAKALIEDMVKKSAISDYFADLGRMIPAEEAASFFTSQQSELIRASYTNYFALNDGKLSRITFLETFSDEGDFHSNFMMGMEEYLNAKAKELNLSEQEVDRILTT